MEKYLISNMKIGSTVEGAFAVESAKKGVAKNSKTYLDVTLSDGIDTILCKKWDYTDEPPAIGTLVCVVGVVGEYPPGTGTKQMVLSRMRPVKPDDDIDMDDFVRRSPISDRELVDTVAQLTGIITDDDYRKLVQAVMDRYCIRFYIAPAALYHHQAYTGGLAEHSIQVTKTAINLADNNTDMSLLIAGALLHDIGKIYTYKRDGLSLVMTDAGRLMEHLALGMMLIHEVANDIGMPPQKRMLVEHIMLSHHGKLEWGSTVTPRTKEALIIHQADMACVATSKVDKLVEETPADERWSAYDYKTQTQMLIKRNGNYAIDTIEI